MSREMKPAGIRDVNHVAVAIALLRDARDHLKQAGALRAAERVRRAIKSAEGAARHVRHRKIRTETETLNA